MLYLFLWIFCVYILMTPIKLIIQAPYSLVACTDAIDTSPSSSISWLVHMHLQPVNQPLTCTYWKRTSYRSYSFSWRFVAI